MILTKNDINRVDDQLVTTHQLYFPVWDQVRNQVYNNHIWYKVWINVMNQVWDQLFTNLWK